MLNIGEFSRLCMVTRKTLRHYDEIGLLKPERVLPNGYRCYGYGQLRTMRRIHRLKGYGFSLPEIAMVLACPDPALLARLLSQKREALARQLQDQGEVLRRLSRDAERAEQGEDIMESKIEVLTKEFEPARVYTIRKRFGIKDFDEMFAQVFREVAQKGLTAAGPALTIYHEEEFNPEDSDIELGVVVRGEAKGVRTLAPGLCAYITHQGPYDEGFAEVYGLLGEWLVENGYALREAPFDLYLHEPDDDPKDYAAQVCFPIRKA